MSKGKKFKHVDDIQAGRLEPVKDGGVVTVYNKSEDTYTFDTDIIEGYPQKAVFFKYGKSQNITVTDYDYLIGHIEKFKKLVGSGDFIVSGI